MIFKTYNDFSLIRVPKYFNRVDKDMHILSFQDDGE